MTFFPPLKWEVVFLLVILEKENGRRQVLGGDPEARKIRDPNQDALR